MDDKSLTIYDANFEQIAEKLKEESSKRRRSKTPNELKKKRIAGKDPDTGEIKYVDYVDRPNYQIWLNEHFPGWSIVHFELNPVMATPNEGGPTYPVLFICNIGMRVVDNGVIRVVYGTGSAAVHENDLKGRGTSQLLSKKSETALTNAIKNACSWLDAFFDIRLDEEEQEERLTPPTEEQQDRFKSYLIYFSNEQQTTLWEMWGAQNKRSAEKFLDNIKGKVKQMQDAKQKERKAE